MSVKVTVDGNLGLYQEIAASGFSSFNIENNVPASIASINLRDVQEPIILLEGATGSVSHDAGTAHIFKHSGIVDNFTVNLVNLNLNAGNATSVTLILSQSSTPYLATLGTVDGSSFVDFSWQGNALPIPTADRREIITFSIVNNGTSYEAFGVLTSF